MSGAANDCGARETENEKRTARGEQREADSERQTARSGQRGAAPQCCKFLSVVGRSTENLSESGSDKADPADNMEELLSECETLWNQMQEGVYSDVTQHTSRDASFCVIQLPLLMTRVKALSSEINQWQERSPEISSINPDILSVLGKEEFQKVKEDLEMLLFIVQAKNKQLEEDLKREHQWEKEQKEIVNSLTGIKEETKKQVEKTSTRSLQGAAFNELQNKMQTLKEHKEKLSTALAEFIEEHFPLPENRKARNKKSSKEPDVELISLQEILENLISKLLTTPHEPYVTINDSFWPPYIEMLLRYGIARRHPEDANRMRLEAFHM
ncbi:centromere protein K [Indicator indicator]|uniref:centromere protein K n=1 Tax=Indicator indicator TaxID=1002788 RepID=UPI0023DFAB05|nr:centromere protein K [Indicator indicator]